MSKKCSTDQSFILKEITSLKIHTLLIDDLEIVHCASGLFQKASLFMPKYKMTLLHSQILLFMPLFMCIVVLYYCVSKPYNLFLQYNPRQSKVVGFRSIFSDDILTKAMFEWPRSQAGSFFSTYTDGSSSKDPLLSKSICPPFISRCQLLRKIN